jgi:hypothetical protein
MCGVLVPTFGTPRERESSAEAVPRIGQSLAIDAVPCTYDVPVLDEVLSRSHGSMHHTNVP